MKYINMEEAVEAINDLQEEIKEKQNQIELIKNINWSKPVDEKTWHAICETSLRTSDLLKILVTNTFPDAQNIIIHPNYVYFDLYGFECAIPTSRNEGIYINTNWYQKDFGEPTSADTNLQCRMKEYFEAKDNKENWEILFNKRLPGYKSHRKWVKFIMWFCYYKWKNDHRDNWEETFAVSQKHLEQKIDSYHKTRKEMHERTKLMVGVVIPKLSKFSPNVSNLQDCNNLFTLSLNEIAESEGFSLKES